MAKMTDNIVVPMARASIIWLIGEYSDRVSKLAPDVLRKSVKTFCEEENVVKLQILNLAVKLHIAQPKKVALLVQYVLNLAKYDQNYDIRDRARYFRTLIYNNEKCPVLAKHLKKILLAPKPAPILESIYSQSDQYQLGTLSHAINSRVTGYSDLPDFPIDLPDTSVRNVEVFVEKDQNGEKLISLVDGKTNQKSTKKKEKFYSDDESDSQSTEGADPTNDEDEDEEESGSEASDEEETSDTEDNTEKTITKKVVAKRKESDDEKTSSSDDSGESSEESGSDDDDDESSSDEKEQKKRVAVGKVKPVVLKKTEEVEDSESESESNTESSSSSKSEDSETDSEEETLKPVVKAAVIKSTGKEIKKKAGDTKSPLKKAPEAVASLLDLDCECKTFFIRVY